jgi:hypothetical protein
MYRNAKRAVRANSLVSTISRMLVTAGVSVSGCAGNDAMVTSDIVLDATVDTQTLDASVELTTAPPSASPRTGPSRYASSREAGIGELSNTGELVTDAGAALLDAQTADTTDGQRAVDATSPARAMDAGADAEQSVEAAVVPSVDEACDPSGIWALKLQGEVTSPTTPFSNSSGTTRLWALLDVHAAGDAFEGSTRLCGLDFPTISLLPSYGGERYQIQFPRSNSAKPDGLPSGSLRLRADTNGLAFEPLAILLGVQLDNDPLASWPTDGNDVAFDADSDGAAGITTTWATDQGQQLPPVDINGAARAQRTLVTGRVVLGANTYKGCDALAGSAGAARIETHVLGCTLTGGSACSKDQTSILESLKPDYSAAQSNLQAKRLPSGSRCSDVLKALQ